MEGFSEDAGQRGFAGADGALDGDKARLFEEIGHE